jgi:hypothetical protein
VHGGYAEIDAGGIITVNAGNADTWVAAIGGNAFHATTTADAGYADITSKGISVTGTGTGTASVSARGGTDSGVSGKLAGGKATVSSETAEGVANTGSIAVELTNSVGAAYVEALGGSGRGSDVTGGIAEVSADSSITVTGTEGSNAYGARVTAIGGTGEGTAATVTGNGGDASIEAGGKIKAESLVGYARVEAQGGNSIGSTGTGIAGSASVEGSEIEVTRTGTSSAEAIVSAIGGRQAGNFAPSGTDVSGGEAHVSTTRGGISVTSIGSGSGTAAVLARGTDGKGSLGGGLADILSAAGINVTGTAGGDASVEAIAGDAGDDSSEDGVEATVAAKGGAITVGATAADAYVRAVAGDARADTLLDFVTGGTATVTGNGVSVTAGATKSSYVTAVGGTAVTSSVADGNVGGGDARVESKAASDGDVSDGISVTLAAGNSGTAYISATGGTGYGLQAGGDGTVESDAGISANGTAGSALTGATITATGGDGLLTSTATGTGGTGSVVAGGGILVGSVAGNAGVFAQGGNSMGTAGTGAAGSASVTGSEISVTRTGTSASSAMLSAVGGRAGASFAPAGTNVSGGQATIETKQGGISVTSSGTGSGTASVLARGTDGKGTLEGGLASVQSASGITVTGTAGGTSTVAAASVTAIAGNAGADSIKDGAPASVTAGGAISVASTAGIASLSATAGHARTATTTDVVTGGEATVSGYGISVTKNGNAAASLTAIGGSDAGSVPNRNLAGGAASVISRALAPVTDPDDGEDGEGEEDADDADDADKTVPGSIIVVSEAGTAGNATLSAVGGTGYGSLAGGAGTVEADGDIVVTGTVGSVTTGAIVTATGGDGIHSASDVGTGAAGSVLADGRIKVSSVSGLALLQARGGDSTGGTGDNGAAGAGVVQGSTIDVLTSGAASARVEALGGYSTTNVVTGNNLPSSGNTAGGEASVTTTAGDIKVVSNGTGAASVQATASNGSGSHEGGSALVTSAGGITVTGAKGGGAFIGATAGNSGNTGTTADGGAAKVTASGAIAVESGSADAAISVRGGANDSFAGAESGLALVQGAGISVTGGTAPARSASITVTGGDGSSSADAGAARLDSISGDARHDVAVVSGVGAAAITVTAGSSANVDGTAGAGASLRAKDLDILADGAGLATVTVAAGSLTPAGGGVGGDVLVDVSGDLTVSGKDSVGSGGRASLTPIPGSGGASGTSGHSLLSVGENLTVDGGDGVTNAGGSATVGLFETVTVGNRLSVDSGRASDPYLGGGGYFSATNLKARAIELTKSGDGANFGFSAGNLDVTDRDTVIKAVGTALRTAPAVSDARFGTVTVSDHRLDILNEGGAIEINRLVVPSGEEATLYQESSANSAIYRIDFAGATVTSVLPADFQAGETFMEAELVDISSATLYVDATQTSLSKGDRFYLYKGDLTADDDTRYVYSEEFDSTFAILYDMAADPDDPDGLAYVVRSAGAHPRLKALSEGIAAGQAFLNQGSDLLSGEGVTSAISAAADAGPSFFSAISYGKSRYETGSHVDVDGVSFLLGAALGTDVSFGRLTVGAFFEIGDGSYDTYNDFAAHANVEGSGDTKYVGGGLLARLDFAKSDSGMTYVEASGRAGRSSTDFRSDDFNRPVAYDVDSNYFGIHLGLGRIFNITDATSLDLYGKWLFTHQSANDIVTGGEAFHFDAVTSHRLRVGARLSTAVSDLVKPYFGLAYEHEVDGKASASVLGAPIDVPELKGGTGIGELGVSLVPSDGLTLDVGIQGYAGARQGVSGSVRLVYNF